MGRKSRSMVAIVLMGVGSVCALGMIMRFAVQSDSSLQDSIRFKQQMIGDFAPRGIQEVALRRLRNPRGYELVLTAELPKDARDQERLDREVADYFVRTHADTSTRLLRISYVEPASWGFRSAHAEPKHQADIALPDVRRRVALEKRRTQLAADVENVAGCELDACEIDGRLLRVVVIVPAERWDAVMSEPGGTKKLTRQLEQLTRRQLRGYYGEFVLRLVGVEEPDPSTDSELGDVEVSGAIRTTLVELEFDRGGREVQ